MATSFKQTVRDTDDNEEPKGSSVVSFPGGEVINDFESRVRHLIQSTFGEDFLCQMSVEKGFSEMDILDIATCPEGELDGRIEIAFANRVYEKLQNKTI